MTAEPIYRRDTQAERARAEREYKFAEARHLMSYGVDPDEIVARLGTTRAALERLAYRWDVTDVRDYVRVAHSDRRPARHCPDCGRKRTGKNHGQRCWDCYRASRCAA